MTVTPLGTLTRAALRPGERKVVGFSCGVLCAVDNPPGYGFRLVGLLENGVARVIELPGFTKDEALIVARTWADYPEVIDEAAGLTRSWVPTDRRSEARGLVNASAAGGEWVDIGPVVRKYRRVPAFPDGHLGRPVVGEPVAVMIDGGQHQAPKASEGRARGLVIEAPVPDAQPATPAALAVTTADPVAFTAVVRR